LFYELDSPISLAFLARFGCHDAAAQVDEQQMTAWLQTVPPAGTRPGQRAVRPSAGRGSRRHRCRGAAQAAVTAALAAALTALRAQVKTLETRIAAQLAAHPDAHIFTSLPRAGMLRGCWPRPGTVGPSSPTRNRWPGCPESRRSPASPASTPRPVRLYPR
jgi:hypothetical protein